MGWLPPANSKKKTRPTGWVWVRLTPLAIAQLEQLTKEKKASRSAVISALLEEREAGRVF